MGELYDHAVRLFAAELPVVAAVDRGGDRRRPRPRAVGRLPGGQPREPVRRQLLAARVPPRLRPDRHAARSWSGNRPRPGCSTAVGASAARRPRRSACATAWSPRPRRSAARPAPWRPSWRRRRRCRCGRSGPPCAAGWPSGSARPPTSSSAEQNRLRTTADFAEGVAASSERREPDLHGVVTAPAPAGRLGLPVRGDHRLQPGRAERCTGCSSRGPARSGRTAPAPTTPASRPGGASRSSLSGPRGARRRARRRRADPHVPVPRRGRRSGRSAHAEVFGHDAPGRHDGGGGRPPRPALAGGDRGRGGRRRLTRPRVARPGAPGREAGSSRRCGPRARVGGASHGERAHDMSGDRIEAGTIGLTSGRGDEIEALPRRGRSTPGPPSGASWSSTTCPATTPRPRRSPDGSPPTDTAPSCPNLFHRYAPGASSGDGAAAARAAGGVPDAQCLEDVAGAMAFLKAQPGRQRQGRRDRLLLGRPPELPERLQPRARRGGRLLRRRGGGEPGPAHPGAAGRRDRHDEGPPLPDARPVRRRKTPTPRPSTWPGWRRS